MLRREIHLILDRGVFCITDVTFMPPPLSSLNPVCKHGCTLRNLGRLFLHAVPVLNVPACGAALDIVLVLEYKQHFSFHIMSTLSKVVRPAPGHACYSACNNLLQFKAQW